MTLANPYFHYRRYIFIHCGFSIVMLCHVIFRGSIWTNYYILSNLSISIVPEALFKSILGKDSPTTFWWLPPSPPDRCTLLACQPPNARHGRFDSLMGLVPVYCYGISMSSSQEFVKVKLPMPHLLQMLWPSSSWCSPAAHGSQDNAAPALLAFQVIKVEPMNTTTNIHLVFVNWKLNITTTTSISMIISHHPYLKVAQCLAHMEGLATQTFHRTTAMLLKHFNSWTRVKGEDSRQTDL